MRSTNIPRVMWLLANREPMTRVEVMAELPGLSWLVLRDILYDNRKAYFKRYSGRPSRFALSDLGALQLELHLIDTGRASDAAVLSRRRFEAYYCAAGTAPDVEPDGRYRHPLVRSGWATWCAALGLPIQ